MFAEVAKCCIVQCDLHKISLDGKPLEIGLSFQRVPGGMGPMGLNHVLGCVETDKLPLEKWRRLSPTSLLLPGEC